MFGYTTIRTRDLDALRTEIKGYYSNEGEVNEYFRAIANQLKGTELVKPGALTPEQIKDAYETIAPVMGVVNYIADNVGEVSRYIELRDLKTGDYIEKHWIIDLLNKPNDRFTRRKFFTAWAVNRLLFGDAFTYAPKAVGADLGKIKEMYILPGWKVVVEKGGVLKPLKGVKFVGGVGEGIEVEGKIFESFDYNLDDTSFRGTSKLAAAATYLSVIDRAMQREATTLNNGGPANLVTPAASSNTPALPAQVDDMEKKLNAKANANRNLALRTSIDVHTLGDNPVNLSILESHKDAINALCFVYKLPVDLYLGQAKYENAKEAKKTVYEQLAIPMVNEFAEDFLSYLDLSGELELVVNTDKIEVLRDSRSDVLDCLEKMHASLNELREANGYDPIEEDWAYLPIMPMGVQFGNEGGAFPASENEEL